MHRVFKNLKLLFTWFWIPKLWFFFLTVFDLPAFFCKMLLARRDRGERRKWRKGKGSGVENSVFSPSLQWWFPICGVKKEASWSDIAFLSCCWWCLRHNKTVSTWPRTDTRDLVKFPASVSLFSVYLQEKCGDSIIVLRFDQFNYWQSHFSCILMNKWLEKKNSRSLIIKCVDFDFIHSGDNPVVCFAAFILKSKFDLFL